MVGGVGLAEVNGGLLTKMTHGGRATRDNGGLIGIWIGPVAVHGGRVI